MAHPPDLPGDPVQWVRDIEAVWQAHDATRAAQGYAGDAVLYWGPGREQRGAELRARPAKWFAHASDLQIEKQYVAHTDTCIVTSWRSRYTDPQSGRRMNERGIEYFVFDKGLIREQHAWQHSWSEDTPEPGGDFSTD